jgi:hypothetical protein
LRSGHRFFWACSRAAVGGVELLECHDDAGGGVRPSSCWSQRCCAALASDTQAHPHRAKTAAAREPEPPSPGPDPPRPPASHTTPTQPETSDQDARPGPQDRAVSCRTQMAAAPVRRPLNDLHGHPRVRRLSTRGPCLLRRDRRFERRDRRFESLSGLVIAAPPAADTPRSACGPARRSPRAACSPS